MIVIPGKEIARNIIKDLKKRPVPRKILAAFLVGSDPASVAFLARKEAIARELGIAFQLRRVPKTVSQTEAEEWVKELSADPAVGGIIVQLPLPANFDRAKILAAVHPQKDVDALSPEAGIPSPIVKVVQAILDFVDWSLEDKTVAVVGRGILVGKPVAEWLGNEILKFKNLNIKIADSKTENLKEFLAEADLIITGVGKAELIKPEWLKEGAGVIDFGFPPDLDNSQSAIRNSQLSFYTPTPGGTGPILVAKLFENFYALQSD